tara:strand:+ start:1401 stop:2765 length:1365 start_codon:yes stop_codon:yes gene_type:complete
MSKRVNAGDISVNISVFRNGEQLKSQDGGYNLVGFLRAWEVYESVESATIEATFVFEDSAGISNIFTGSEEIKFRVYGSVVERTYRLRSYNINSRQRIKQTTDVFIVNCCSDEYAINEVVNVFGKSDKIFDETESSSIVKTMIKDYLQSGKKVFSEESLNKQTFIATNWRPFDTVYWITNRSVRKKQSGGDFQNGFAFYENSLGYHFKSLDKMIDDINEMTPTKGTDPQRGSTRLYEYIYSPKKSDDGGNDQFKIDSIAFPEERNFLMGLRHGTWTGFSMGFDPVNIANSQMGGESADLALDKYQYKITEIWNSMSHLGGKKAVNPVSRVSDDYKSLIDSPKRTRYAILPYQNFDPKDKQEPQKNYESLVYLQAYQWLRMESLKNTKLQIVVPGNLDLYAGSGVSVTMPTTQKSGDTIKTDKRFSGRYMIVTIAHKGTPDSMSSEMLLMKDAVL